MDKLSDAICSLLRLYYNIEVSHTHMLRYLPSDLINTAFSMVQAMVICVSDVLYVRISGQVYNSRYEYELLASAIEELASQN